MRNYQVVWVASAVSLYCLHTLRGLFPLFSALPPLFSLLGMSFFLIKKRKLNVDSNGFVLLLTFIFCAALPIFYSFIWYPEEDYTQAFFRYFFMLPFLLLAVFAIDSHEAVTIALKAYVVFVVLGAVSIYYQVLFGPVSWFAESSEREGLVRFSSLVGSLTAYGVYAVFALPVIAFVFRNTLVRVLFFLIIVSGMLLTLQKAAVMNILVFGILAFMFERRAFKGVVMVCSIAGLLFLYGAYFLDVSYVVSTVDNVLRLRSNSGVSDVSVYQSILDRLWSLPAKLYEMHGGIGMALGVGMVGGSGTLGFIDFPMSHNGFFDLLFIGGIASLLSFLSVWVVVLIKLRVDLKAQAGLVGADSRLCKASLYIWLLFIINFVFSGVLYFQPYGGVVFYTIMVFFLLRSRQDPASVHVGSQHIS